ncbi:hypothetical protein ACTHPH_23910 [Paenibacillus pasadenensis]|uniref:hypothetical protein n=1 Tax=Paenibacillus pasadenensis TaxID=217090 RepID=UPI00048C6555|nr:hypothetical protein [Paenibacillus pasadenensis]
MAAQLEQVRDLEADLAICEYAAPAPIRTKPCMCGHCDKLFLDIAHSEGRLDPEDARFIVEARVGWPHAIRRAIAAEAQVDKLQEEIRLLHDLLHEQGIPWD